MRIFLIAAVLYVLALQVASAAEATFTTKSLMPEIALKAAQAALAQCRKDGFQVAVAVVDRSGIAQVMLRDQLAGPHTADTAVNKAWTAANFKIATGELAQETQAGKPMSGLRQNPRVVAVAGGLMIQGGGVLLGAIAVSGAPGGSADEACAAAGIKAISDDIEF
ncbi:MAG: heme-binding protein [Betaproteobacteria bacterium]|nr:heme-binding protein [Betaproteobacteria bacterium]